MRVRRGTGSEAFWQSAQLDLDRACETARKKTVRGSGGVASLLISNWREPLRLTLDTSNVKKASLPDCKLYLCTSSYTLSVGQFQRTLLFFQERKRS